MFEVKQIGKLTDSLMPSILGRRGDVSSIPRRKTGHDYWMVRSSDGHSVMYSIKPHMVTRTNSQIKIDSRDHKNSIAVAQEHDCSLGLIFAFQETETNNSDKMYIVVLGPDSLVIPNNSLKYNKGGSVVLSPESGSFKNDITRIGGSVYCVMVGQLI